MTTINHKTLANGNTHMFCPDGLLSARPASPTNSYNNFYYATDAHTLFFYDGANWINFTSNRHPGDILPNGATNFCLSNNVSDATNDIDIAVGATFDNTDTYLLVLATAMTKRLDATWAAGTNQGGLDTGSKANSTGYHVFVIGNPTTGAVDVLFSTSLTPTLPSGYTKYQRIGAIYNQSTGIIRPFKQFGKDFVYGSGVSDINTTSLPSSFTDITLSTPSGIKTEAFLNTGFSGAA